MISLNELKRYSSTLLVNRNSFCTRVYRIMGGDISTRDILILVREGGFKSRFKSSESYEFALRSDSASIVIAFSVNSAVLPL
jgi:hypothetical protein